MRSSFVAIIAAVTASGFAYTNPYTADFDSGLPAGWSDPVNANTVLVGGNSTPADSPAYGVPPNTATGFNNTGWLRLGTTNTAGAGVVLGLWDGTGGGGATDGTDYTVAADVFIVVDPTIRHQHGLAGRATGTNNTPFEFFYSNKTPSQSDGYGWRSGGSTTQYASSDFPVETTNKWVRMKMTFHGSTVDVFLDDNKDGIYEASHLNIPLTATTGKAGFFSVLNDPSNSSVAVTGQYAYFDNFQYTPAVAAVSDWSMY